MSAWDEEVRGCRGCRVWDPENQWSVQRELENDPLAYEGRLFVTIPNGMSLNVPGVGAIPLWTEFVVCSRHARTYPDGPVWHSFPPYRDACVAGEDFEQLRRDFPLSEYPWMKA